MSKKNIVAIIQHGMQHRVVSALQEVGVPGVSVMYIKGYGEYINQYSRDMLSDGVRLEVLVDESGVDKVINVIMDSAWTGQSGDGVITVTNLDSIYRIRDKRRVN